MSVVLLAAGQYKVNVKPVAQKAGTIGLNLISVGSIRDSASNLLAQTAQGTEIYRLNYAPGQPVNQTPADLTTDLARAPLLTASSFVDVDSADTHLYSQWQVRTEWSPQDFSDTVFDSGKSSSLLQIQVPLGTLEPNTDYAWRVRYADSYEVWSAWSTPTGFRTQANQQPSAPVNQSPADLTSDVALVMALVSSGFSDPDAGDTHRASQWQLRRDSAPTDFTQTLFNSGEDSSNLISLDIPEGVLETSTTYWWRVRHQGRGRFVERLVEPDQLHHE